MQADERSIVQGGLIMADASPPSPKLLYPGWQHELQAALLELDTEKLRERVAAAETAIFNRLQAISQGSNHTAERQATMSLHCCEDRGRLYAEAERIGRVIERLGSYRQIPQPAGLDRARLGE